MPAHYTVTRMTRDEMQLAMQWATNEGWNPGLHDAECFYQTDPNGFFAGKLNDQIIAVGSAVIYDEQFAFCGLYIVDPVYRGKGYGLELTKQRLAYVGDRNAGIDGVPAMLSKYERLGYKVAHANARYSGQSLPVVSPLPQAIKPLLPQHFEALSHYDRRHFPAPRTSFLRCWITQPQCAAFGWFRDDELKGYGVIRSCLHGFKIGPLFADTTAIADDLFLAMTSYAKWKRIFLDIPETNPHAVAMVNRYQMEKVFETSRMYLKEPPELPMENIYGITTFELG
ncbi:GNAT family N-acetyltransferase [Legionella spiritensis]|uniref:GNAT family N-acetyltransferase n=1 Tax=Legionella spiritensis TaxID=452 RepID=UPI000F6EFBE6|nr:GNAT family N-acetyltransferase [Legionella spiritensis]VEG92051.1 acetyltransferase, GNAT family [Legionella spiritensis]